MIINESNGSTSSILSDTYRPVPDQIRRMLGFLDNDEDFSYLLFHVPDDAGWPDAPGFREHEWSNRYLQAGGTAERLGIELRRVDDDGVERQYVVGRAHDLEEPATEVLEVGEARDARHPAELFDADAATPVFYHYFRFQTVPEEMTLRHIDM